MDTLVAIDEVAKHTMIKYKASKSKADEAAAAASDK